MNNQISSSDPGGLQIISGRPQQNGSPDDGIFLLSGDASTGNATCLAPAPGVDFPQLAQNLGEDGFRLSLYHINDLHGHLARFIHQGEDAVISRIAWQVRAQRKALAEKPDRALMFFSAGDDCIGSIFDELLGTNPTDFQMHAAYRLYSALGMDAACLGNHEFDIGFALLRESIQRDARFPVLAANVFCPQLENVCHPAAIFVVKGVRVGVIGLVTQAELKISDSSCYVTNPILVANNLVSLMRPYCDVLIILSHLGLSLASSSIPMQTAGDVELAQNLPYGGVNLIIGGHTHHDLNPQGLSPQNIVNGIPIVQAGSLGDCLGQVDLKVTSRSAAVTDVRLIATEKLPLDLDFDREFTQPVLDHVRCLLTQELGTVADDPHLATDYVRSFLASAELPLANFVTDGLVSRLEQADQPVDLAMVDSSVLRRGLDFGETLTLGDWFNIMPFADTLRIYQLTGRQLYDLLQDNAQRVNLVGEPHTERGFLHFSKGLRYAIVPGARRSQSRAIEILVNGSPLEERFEQVFRLAGTNFVRELSGAWEKSVSHTAFASAPDLKHYPCQETEIFLRREMLAYIKQAGGVTCEAGAVCDGRLLFLEHAPFVAASLTVAHFTSYVSRQKHAMAGAVIAASAAEAVALGQACVAISQDAVPDSNAPVEALNQIRLQMLTYANRDANAIAELVAMRAAGQELQGRQLLCQLPADLCHACIQAARLLQDFRSQTDERVRDDLEMSIRLLAGAAGAAMLLLDSNLRHWPDLAPTFEPILSDLLSGLETIQPVNRIRA